MPVSDTGETRPDPALWFIIEDVKHFLSLHETLAFIANDLVSKQRNSKACGRVKARPLTYPSGRRKNNIGRPAEGKPD